MSTETITLSHDEAERLRAILQQHDKQSMPKQFDLNAPPKQPYTFQPFPQMLYDHQKRETMKVYSAEERSEWLAQGWREDAYPREVPTEVDLDPDEAQEVRNVDRILQTKRGPGVRPHLNPESSDYLIEGNVDGVVQAKRGPGRPRKVEIAESL